MPQRLKLRRTIPFRELEATLRKIKFRGVYDKTGKPLAPYRNASFRFATVYPARTIGASPEIAVSGKRMTLFSPQPTIYQNQIEIMRTLDTFLASIGYKINTLKHAVEYEWPGRGTFHVLPPIVEKHTYLLRNGFLDLDALSKRFKNSYTKDALGTLHDLSRRYLNNFHIDEVSKLDHLDVFHSNAPLINYGLEYTGKHDFHIICDGMHRIDYALETLRQPITVVLIEPQKMPLLPYYAFPFSFHPTIRLSSKRSERMFPRLERDKVHLFNDFIKKILHYDWTEGGLNVSSLRSQTEIY